MKALKALDAGELRSDEWTCTEGVVLYRGKVYVLDNPQLHHDLVHAHHSATVTGHPRCWKMLELVSRCRREIEITREEIYSTHTTKKAGYVVERDRPRYI